MHPYGPYGCSCPFAYAAKESKEGGTEGSSGHGGVKDMVHSPYGPTITLRIKVSQGYQCPLLSAMLSFA